MSFQPAADSPYNGYDGEAQKAGMFGQLYSKHPHYMIGSDDNEYDEDIQQFYGIAVAQRLPHKSLGDQ